MESIVLIPAAGAGTRMGAGVNKQYLTLADRPVLAHTVGLFENHPRVDRIYIVSPPAEVPYCQEEIAGRYGFSKVAGVVAGGDVRQESVYRGLCACGAQPEDLVVVHDGARPLFPARLLESVLEAAAREGACVAGVPVKDTVKEVAAGRIEKTPDRRRLWLAQTPQAFRAEVLVAAHRKARAEGYGGTDDAALVERLGRPVAMVEGSYRNLKITTPEDLAVAQALLAFGEGDAL